MIFDKQTTFCDDQRFLATGNSVDVIDLGKATTYADDSLSLVVCVTAEVGNTAFAAELETSSDNSSFTKVLGLTRPTGHNTFAAGLGGLRLQRYNRVRINISSGSPDVTVTAAIAAGFQQWHAPADSPRIA